MIQKNMLPSVGCSQ